ncbi:phosphatase PAP2 family protein [Actinacidiphila glaucinigra]|uniref:Undecaprenyl-diphosphatase n=1 Tax=Actinacidiphila glaucinigra TaxID=235986 RepID=A0A239CY50_9ACTN|nr:phosphatase PAP2 family protein [Actinacidiphila glaucinigra]SNS24688.1 undecaprenyl-diphosphatase [Actinacidiphila glaucinigra]
MHAPPAPSDVRDPDRALRTACLSQCAAASAAFLLLLGLVAARWGPLLAADRALTVELHAVAVRHSGWTRLNRVLTDWVWDPLTMRLLLLAAVVWLLVRRENRQALWLVLAGTLGWVLQQAAKALVGRERPRWPDPVDSAAFAAFPSGHATTAALVCGALLWLLLLRVPARSPWCVAACAVAFVSVVGVGFTRVYLGVHWPSDVLGGWLLAAAVLTGTAALCEPWRTGTAEPDRPAS